MTQRQVKRGRRERVQRANAPKPMGRIEAALGPPQKAPPPAGKPDPYEPKHDSEEAPTRIEDPSEESE